MKHFDSRKGHFIVMLKLIHPTDHGVMKEPAFLIRYAIWISIGCHASYPIRRWQAAFPVDMQSVICQLRVLMKRKTYEESYIQTDGKFTLQPYVQLFPYWFLIKDSAWNFSTGQVQDRLMKLVAPSRSAEFKVLFFHGHSPALAFWTTLTLTNQYKKKKKKDLKICPARAI